MPPELGNSACSVTYVNSLGLGILCAGGKNRWAPAFSGHINFLPLSPQEGPWVRLGD